MNGPSRLPTLALAALLAGLSAPAAAEDHPVTLIAPHFHEEVTFFGVGPDNQLLPRELDLLQQLLRCRRTARQRPIDPQLSTHLVEVARHFRRPIQVISGFRSVPVRGHRRSFHLRGMAADVHVPGVPPAKVRDLAVRRGIGGIGFYPRSGFVHLDVRERRFWWVDYSRPGQLEPLIPDPEGDAPPVPTPPERADLLTSGIRSE